MAAFDNPGGDGEQRDWLLHCEGMAVEATDGFVGHVVEPLYRHSSRWDRPWALAVRGERGIVTVPIEAVDWVDRAAARIGLGRALHDLPPA